MKTYQNVQVRKDKQIVCTDAQVSINEELQIISSLNEEKKWCGTLQLPNGVRLSQGERCVLVVPGYMPATIVIKPYSNGGTVQFKGSSKLINEIKIGIRKTEEKFEVRTKEKTLGWVVTPKENGVFFLAQKYLSELEEFGEIPVLDTECFSSEQVVDALLDRLSESEIGSFDRATFSSYLQAEFEAWRESMTVSTE